MAIFICIKSWVKCLYAVTHMGGVYRTSDNTWPIFLYMTASEREYRDFSW